MSIFAQSFNRQSLAARKRRVGGFTLIEVLVAMTILAVGASALVSAAAGNTFRSGKLREREVARWVATNHLNTLQALPTWPDTGEQKTEVEMVKQTWYVRTRTKNEDFGLRRMDIEVRLNEDAEGYIYSVTGFAGNPEHSF